MKPPLSSRKGSALITVIILIGVMALLTASMLKYSSSEQRMNERQRLVLRSRNMTENTILYASEQITNKLYKLRSASPMAFMDDNAIGMPSDDVLRTKYSEPDDSEVYAGLTTSSGLLYIDPALAANATNPNAGLQVSNSTVPIIAKSTMRHPALGEVTTYAEQNLEVAMMPLFQFAIFYNMDLEFGPGPNMTISGPVHTNGDFISRIQTGFSNTIRFTDRVTSAKGFYANTAHRGSTYMADGSVDDGPGGSGPLIFRKPSDPVSGGTSVKSSGGTWRDHKWGGATETATTKIQFRNFATSTYGGNFRTSVHGVTKLVLPAIGDYDESDPELRKNGRQVIEAPDATDAGGVLGTKFARNAGLYIVVNPDGETRTGKLPDGSSVSMRARSYRAFLNTVSGSSHTMREIVLPGQPSYGPLNAFVNDLPNAYRVDTSVGHNQVLRIPQGGGGDVADTGYASPAIPTYASFLTNPYLSDAYFYDMRRAFNNTGFPFSRSGSNSFRPRPVAKIDFDMTRLKMAVERTLLNSTASSIYFPSAPNNNTWSSSIFNPSASPANYGLGLAIGADTSFTSFPAADFVPVVHATQSTAFFPGSITVQAYSQAGSATPALVSARFVIETYNGSTWSTSYTSAADENSKVFTIPAGITQLRISQYLAGGTTALLDQQIIPVVSDTGTTVTATLTNERHVIPANSATGGFLFGNAITEMKVWVGGIDDTANWSFSASTASGSVTGYLGGGSTGSSSTGYGAHANRYTATGITSTSGTTQGTVTITASKTGYSNVSRTFTLIKQSALAGGANAPTQTGRWLQITGNPLPDPFRFYLAPQNATEAVTAAANPAPYALAVADFVNSSGASPWFDGITIYIHSVGAEDLTVTGSNNSAVRNRVDSAVRLWNGRGPLISLSGSSFAGRTGLSFVTNDAVYIMGHYNADGSINSTLTSTGTGGYSGRYPESSSEMLTSVMGDAISIFSQPEMTRSGSSPSYRYYQSSGWSDSLSAHRRDDSASYSTSWATSNPSSSNTQDGVNTSVRPALMPNLTVSSSVTGTGPRPTSSTLPSTETAKFTPSETEVSTCLLTGVVPTVRSTASGPKQTSGGVHNFPRLSENWAGSVALWIRGSLVAMFESQVAVEPWGIRWYQGAIRNWGLHESLRDENHDVPLEPIVLGARRMSYRELTSAEFETMKTTIEALPH